MTTAQQLMASGLSALNAEAVSGNVKNNLTATGSSYADALQCPSDFMIFTTVPPGSGVRLPTHGQFGPHPGDKYMIVNYGQEALRVYSAGTITGQPYIDLGQNDASEFIYLGGDVWYQFSSNVTILVAPAFTTLALPGATAGVPYSFRVLATGSPAPSITTFSNLPSGGSLATDGTLTFVATAADVTASPFSITFDATNDAGRVSTTLSLSVSASGSAPTWTTAAGLIGTALVGQAWNFQFVFAGSPAPSVSLVSGSWPAGTGVDATGAMSGTPTSPGGTGTNVVLRLTNTAGTADRTFHLDVNEFPWIDTGVPLPNATSGAAYSPAALTFLGFPAPTLTIRTSQAVATKPAGLGTIDISTAGVWNGGNSTTLGTTEFVIKVSNAVGDYYGSYSITVDNAFPGSPFELWRYDTGLTVVANKATHWVGTVGAKDMIPNPATDGPTVNTTDATLEFRTTGNNLFCAAADLTLPWLLGVRIRVRSGGPAGTIQIFKQNSTGNNLCQFIRSSVAASDLFKMQSGTTVNGPAGDYEDTWQSVLFWAESSTSIGMRVGANEALGTSSAFANFIDPRINGGTPGDFDIQTVVAYQGGTLPDITARGQIIAALDGGGSATPQPPLTFPTRADSRVAFWVSPNDTNASYASQNTSSVWISGTNVLNQGQYSTGSGNWSGAPETGLVSQSSGNIKSIEKVADPDNASKKAFKHFTSSACPEFFPGSNSWRARLSLGGYNMRLRDTVYWYACAMRWDTTILNGFVRTVAFEFGHEIGQTNFPQPTPRMNVGTSGDIRLEILRPNSTSLTESGYSTAVTILDNTNAINTWFFFVAQARLSAFASDAPFFKLWMRKGTGGAVTLMVNDTGVNHPNVPLVGGVSYTWCQSGVYLWTPWASGQTSMLAHSKGMYVFREAAPQGAEPTLSVTSLMSLLDSI